MVTEAKRETVQIISKGYDEVVKAKHDSDNDTFALVHTRNEVARVIVLSRSEALALANFIVEN